ncbi:MAG: hypothetical protein R3350_07325, partial [Saprospiraceae bacterium]|nr:hypothetical protein [Saprospiraceae bacterium]
MNSTVINLLLATLLALFATACGIGGDSLYIHYQSPFEEITVENGRMTHVGRIHHTPPEQPFVATPDSITVQKIIDDRKLSEVHMANLRSTLEQYEFMKLDSVYGAPENMRFYPYTLRVKYEGREKEVLFRSHPAHEGQPLAFGRVQRQLRKISES